MNVLKGFSRFFFTETFTKMIKADNKMGREPFNKSEAGLCNNEIFKRELLMG